MEEHTERAPRIWPDIVGGAGMGLLLGTLVGLSSSPVVGVVVGALASILAVFLGLDVRTGSAIGALRINGARIGALGVATVVGLGLGLSVRVNNPFLPDPVSHLQRWQQALPGDPTLAKQLMVFERTGIVPSRFQYGQELPGNDVTVALQEGAATRTAVLFSALAEFDVCTRLDPGKLESPQAVLAVYSRRGAPGFLPQVAERIARMPEAEQEVAVALVHDVLCLMQRAEGK
jgi:hypothetical protein